VIVFVRNGYLWWTPDLYEAGNAAMFFCIRPLTLLLLIGCVFLRFLTCFQGLS